MPITLKKKRKKAETESGCMTSSHQQSGRSLLLQFKLCMSKHVCVHLFSPTYRWPCEWCWTTLWSQSPSPTAAETHSLSLSSAENIKMIETKIISQLLSALSQRLEVLGVLHNALVQFYFFLFLLLPVTNWRLVKKEVGSSVLPLWIKKLHSDWKVRATNIWSCSS